jgi:pimeloyl-ACP methyl ester carboxylesterase
MPWRDILTPCAATRLDSFKARSYSTPAMPYQRATEFTTDALLAGTRRSMFIGGKSDWGVYQTPGAAESMQKTACSRMVGFHLVDDAGHWVQQEQPGKVTELLTKFLQDQSTRDGHKR